jgi:hypothetical protein
MKTKMGERKLPSKSTKINMKIKMGESGKSLQHNTISNE